MANPKPTDELQGEGNITAARRYNEGAHEHARNADIEAEADAARPQDSAEAKSLKQAEDAGRARAKDEDPLLDEPERIDRDGIDDAVEDGRA